MMTPITRQALKTHTVHLPYQLLAALGEALPAALDGSITISNCPVHGVLAPGWFFQSNSKEKLPPVNAAASNSTIIDSAEPLWPPNGNNAPPSRIAFGSWVG